MVVLNGSILYDPAVFSERLSLLIGDTHQTISGVAEAIKQPPLEICAYLNREAAPSAAVIFALAEHFDVNPVWLFGLDVSPKRPQNRL